jgi:hypothetical protein
MSTEKRALLKQRLASGDLSLQPLTFPQRELWEASPVAVGDHANHICCFIEARGRITAPACEAAVQMVVQRHEALRTSFLPGKEQPMQVIRREAPPQFRARTLEVDEQTPEAVEKLAEAIFREPFDLVQGPLYRTEMLSRSADDHVLVLAMHHGIADGWTLGIFVQDLVAAYLQGLRGVPGGLPPVALSYAAWGAAERAYWQPAVLQPRGAYWRSQLAGRARLWDHLAPTAPLTGPHQKLTTHFSPELADAARELARQHGATLYSTLLTAFQIALAQWTGCKDITVTTPVANRAKEAVHETMGYFAGIVPVRARVDHDRPFAASLRETHRLTVDAFAQAMPFAELVRALGEQTTPGQPPIFEVRFALQNHPIPEVALPGLSAKLRMRSTGTARFYLACEVTEDGDRLEVVWLYRQSMFSPDDIEQLNRKFEAVLLGCSPESRVATLSK